VRPDSPALHLQLAIADSPPSPALAPRRSQVTRRRASPPAPGLTPSPSRTTGRAPRARLSLSGSGRPSSSARQSRRSTGGASRPRPRCRARPCSEPRVERVVGWPLGFASQSWQPTTATLFYLHQTTQTIGLLYERTPTASSIRPTINTGRTDAPCAAQRARPKLVRNRRSRRLPPYLEWPASDGRPNRSNDQQAEGPSPALLRWPPRAFSPTAGPVHPPTRSRRLRYRQAGLLDGTTTHTHTSGMLSCHARTLTAEALAALPTRRLSRCSTSRPAQRGRGTTSCLDPCARPFNCNLLACPAARLSQASRQRLWALKAAGGE